MSTCKPSDLRLWREANDWHVWSIDANGKPGKLLQDGLPNLKGYTRRVVYFCESCNGQWPRYEAALHHLDVKTSHRRPPPRRSG